MLISFDEVKDHVFSLLGKGKESLVEFVQGLCQTINRQNQELEEASTVRTAVEEDNRQVS